MITFIIYSVITFLSNFISKNVLHSFQKRKFPNIKQTALPKKKDKPSRNSTTFIVFLDIKRTCQRDKKINKPKKPTRAHRARSPFCVPSNATEVHWRNSFPFQETRNYDHHYNHYWPAIFCALESSQFLLRPFLHFYADRKPTGTQVTHTHARAGLKESRAQVKVFQEVQTTST